MTTTQKDISRRSFLLSTAAAGSAVLATGATLPADMASAQSAGPSLLDPATIAQFQAPLANPLAAQLPGVHFPAPGAKFTLSINETFQVLGKLKNNAGDIRTRVWGYGLSTGNGVSYPGPTFEIQRGTPISVTFKNDLLGVPNRMPVDTTIDWANPGGLGGTAPVPVVAHLHGGRSQYLSDGLPDAWSTPANGGTVYKGRLFNTPYQYENDQEAGHLWYHDHARGITRTNVYMGLAGFYFIRDDNENALRAANVLPSFPYEVPIVIQDRQFKADGSLFYPSEDATYASVVPTHLPEFFGDVILTNGQIWPKMQVEQRKYRFRVLNGSDSRFYALKVQREGATLNGAPSSPTGAPLKIMVVGNELGLLNNPALAFWYSPPDPAAPGAAANTPGGGISQADTLLIGPGERYDIVVDFSAVPAGTRLLLWNDAASPYNGQPADGVDYVAPTPGLSDRVLAFDVVGRNTKVGNATVDLNTPLRRMPTTPPLPGGAMLRTFAQNIAARRKILLVEGTDSFGRLQTMIGTVGGNAKRDGTFNFQDPITEFPTAGVPEIWEFHNTTADAHPIHMHLVDFRVLDRQAFAGTTGAKTNTDGSAGATLSNVKLVAPAIPAEPWQSGKKDTVVAYPGYITRVLVNFTRPGEYVYHCHILSHEDHEMMRPYQVKAAVAGL